MRSDSEGMSRMANIVYILSAATCLACAILLARGFMRTRGGLLLWSSLCFGGLLVSNFLLVLDRIVLPNVDLYGIRLVITLIAMLVLVFGLVWESGWRS